MSSIETHGLSSAEVAKRARGRQEQARRRRHPGDAHPRRAEGRPERKHLAARARRRADGQARSADGPAECGRARRNARYAGRREPLHGGPADERARRHERDGRDGPRRDDRRRRLSLRPDLAIAATSALPSKQCASITRPTTRSSPARSPCTATVGSSVKASPSRCRRKRRSSCRSRSIARSWSRATTARTDRIAKLVTVQRGVITAEVQHRRQTRFTVTSRLTQPTKVYLRHRLESGWALVDAPSKYMKVGDSQLFEVELGAGETKYVTIAEATPVRAHARARLRRGARHDEGVHRRARGVARAQEADHGATRDPPRRGRPARQDRRRCAISSPSTARVRASSTRSSSR